MKIARSQVRPAPKKVTQPANAWRGWKYYVVGHASVQLEPSNLYFAGRIVSAMEIKFLGESLTNYRAAHAPRKRR